MCVECGKSPCDYRCPNAPEPPAVFVCSGCGDDILEGQDYWEVLGEQFCETCIDKCKHTAELEVDYETEKF